MNTSRKLQTDTHSIILRPITREDIPRIARYTKLIDTRACDYTLGGIILWADYFDYRIAEANDTLYVNGLRPDDPSRRAFYLPMGPASLSAPEYSFAPVPADITDSGISLGDQWSDYLYDIYSFASLSGNVMKKKRNHVNRFNADNPEAVFEPLTAANARLCLHLLSRLGNDGSPSGRAEHIAVARMLLHWTDFAPYLSGAVLKMHPGDEIAAFTIGEIKGDTLHVHVEKADHTIPGSGETIAHLFAADRLRHNPSLTIINRQDDAGSPALQAAKLSWHPLRLLPKSLL